MGLYIYDFAYSTIAVDEHSSLVFCNNSADQGGALYLQTQRLAGVKIGGDSYLEFSYNTATEHGGAICVDEHVCVFNFKSNSSTVMFKNNSAKSCMNSFCSEYITCQTYPVVFHQYHHPSPKRACLYNDNGKPQCTKLSRIVVNWPKVYRGEFSVVAVGYMTLESQPEQ